MKGLFVVVVVLVMAAGGASASNIGLYYGTGSDGAITRSTSGNEAVNTIFATTFTVDAGVTRTLTVGTVVIYATESINIQGTLDGNGVGTGGGSLGVNGGAGMANGGTGSTTSAGATGGPRSAGSGGQTPANLWSMGMASGSTNTAHGRGAGGGGGQTGTAAVAVFGGGGGGGGACNVGGNGGASGTITATGGTGGVGGAGGAGIVLIAPQITIGPSAVVRANGANGASATGSTPNNSAGGGGGAGGVIQIYARYLDEAAGSTITANGGNGGNGGGTGGSGAAGGTGGAAGCNAGTNGASPTNGGGGGGGGGGGIIFRHVDTDNIWRAAWSSSTTYSYGDVVTYNGLSYVAITTHTNQQPDTNSDDWTVMGNSGFNSITVNVAESPGANCADGGRKITSGLDNGDGGGVARDGTLQSGEVDSTSYVCNGSTGATGATGPQGAQGDPGPIGITWMGAWSDATSYAERDAVHYAGSAWYCFAAPCDDAPSPGSAEWDFIANADGNVVFSTADNFSSLGVDGFLFVLFWVAAALFFIYRDWAFSLAFTIPGLLDALFPADIPGEFAQYLLLSFLGVVMQYFAGHRQKFSLHGKRKTGA